MPQKKVWAKHVGDNSEQRFVHCAFVFQLKQEREKPIHIATLRVPKYDANVKEGSRNVIVTPQEFSQIHEVLVKT